MSIIMDKKIIVKRISVAFLGIALAVSVILTGEYGLSDSDKSCYKHAVRMQKEVDEIGFPDFKIADYPVAFCDGDHDYVLTASGSSYQIHKRKPVLDTLAATAYEVEGHYEVIAPTKEVMARVMNTIGGMEQAATGDSELSYDENAQVATIWHEVFHCWQFSKFKKNISILHGGHDFAEEDYGEKKIVEECDTNEGAVMLFQKGAGILQKAAETEDMEQIREYMQQYRDIQEQRNRLLGETVQKLEDYYTSVEGSAEYIEAMVCRCMDEKKYEEYYMENLDMYVNGSAKYYYRGMAQCLILDRIDSTWKAGYDFSEPLIQYIYEKLGI